MSVEMEHAVLDGLDVPLVNDDGIGMTVLGRLEALAARHERAVQLNADLADALRYIAAGHPIEPREYASGVLRRFGVEAYTGVAASDAHAGVETCPATQSPLNDPGVILRCSRPKGHEGNHSAAHGSTSIGWYDTGAGS